MSAPTAALPSSLEEVRKLARLPVLPALVIGILLLGLIFHAEVAAAVRVWYDSTAYSHCYFVIPIAAYIAWDRRDRLAGVPIVPMPWLALGAIPMALAWMAADRLGIMEGRQLTAMAMLELLFLAVLGWPMFRALMAPLLYLFFLVPFGAFLTPALQDFTAEFIEVGLNALAIPHYSDGYIIEIKAGSFYVAEACAGLRFLIASIAFGVLYAVLMYRSLPRRLAFIGASIVIPIIANGFRALGIVVLGQVLGSAEAAAADHVLYGWIFFSIIILLLILAGLPFREDTPLAATARAPLAATAAPTVRAPLPAAPAMRPRAPLLAAGVLVACAALGLALSAGIDRAGASVPPAPALRFTTPAGCAPGQPAEPARPGLARINFACARGALSVTVMIFPPRVNPSLVVAAQRQVTGELDSEDNSFSIIEAANTEPRQWRFVVTEQPARATAMALWVDGHAAPGGLAGRLELARNSLFGAPRATVLMAIGMRSTRRQLAPEEERLARETITAFLLTQNGLADQVRRISTVEGVP